MYNFINVGILSLTLIVLIWYTIETRRIANVTIDSSLRPVILRSGFIANWDTVKFKNNSSGHIEGTPIEFVILRNIALDIHGFIVKDKKCYKLLFGNDITALPEKTTRVTENFGWLKEDSKVFAVSSEDFLDCNMENQIVVLYRDLEGKEYYTIEDSNFVQKSYKGKIRNPMYPL